MHRRFCLPILLLWWLCFVQTPAYAQEAAPAQGDPAAVTVGWAPDRPEESIDIVLPPAAEGATFTLYLGYTGAEPLPDVRLFAQLLDAQQGHSTAAVQFLAPGAAGGPLPTLTLSPTMPAQPVVLQVTGMPAGAAYRGFIGVETGAGVTPIADLAVARPAPPTLLIQEATDQAIPLQSFTPELADTLFLRETAGSAAGAVTLTVSALRTAAGVAAAVTLTPTTFTLPAHGAQRIDLVGELPEQGDYSGIMTVATQETQTPYVLKATRSQAKAQMTMAAVPPPTVILSPLDWLLRWWSPPPPTPVTVNLAETAGAAVAYHAPVLTQLIQETSAAGGVNQGAAYGGWTVSPDANTIQLGDQDIYRLAGSQLTQWTLALADLRQIGAYEGTVRVATTGGQTVETTFQLYVKHDFWLAAVAIALGVFASYFLRRWLEEGRPQALEEATISRARDRVVASIPAPDDPIREQILAELGDVMLANQLDSSTAVAATIEKVNIWLKNYRPIQDVMALTGELEKLGLDAAAAKRQQDAIQELTDELQRKGLDALSDETLATRAQGIYKEIVTASLASVKQAIVALQASWPQAHQDDAEYLKLKELQVGDTLASARAAWPIYIAARARFQVLTCDVFIKQIKDQQAPPVGMDKDDWKALQEDVAARWQERPTSAEFDAIRRDYLTKVLTALRNAARVDLTTYKHPSLAAARDSMQLVIAGIDALLAAPPKDPEQTTVEYRRLQTRFYLTQALYGAQNESDQQAKPHNAAGPNDPTFAAIAARIASELAKPDLTAEAGEQLLHELPSSIKVRGAQMSGGGQPSAASAPLPMGPAALNELPPGPSKVPVDIPSLAAVRQRIARYDLVATLIMVFVSVLLGLNILWASSLTFGSLVDYIGAFLWGFGLHTLNQVALPPQPHAWEFP